MIRRRKGCRNKFPFLLFGLALVPVPLLGAELPCLNQAAGDQTKEEKNCSNHPAASNVATGMKLPHKLPAFCTRHLSNRACDTVAGSPLPPCNRVTSSLGMGNFYFPPCLHGTMRIDWIILLIVCCLCGMGQKVQKKCGICFTAFE